MSDETLRTRGGRTLTTQDVERLSATAEAPIPDDAEVVVAGRWKELRRGRPPVADASGPSPRMSFRVAPELLELAQERAQREHKSVSQVAREALERGLTSA